MKLDGKSMEIGYPDTVYVQRHDVVDVCIVLEKDRYWVYDRRYQVII